jgi:hypothetical protein
MTIRLNKGLPGTKQGSRTWNLELRKHLEEEGYTALKSARSIFYHEEQSTCVNTIISIYVDDALISGDRRRVDNVKAAMQRHWEISDKGSVSHFLGMKIEHDRKNGILTLSQQHYIEKMLEEYSPITKGSLLLVTKTPRGV